MNTYEITTSVTFIVEAEDEYEASQDVESMLGDIAFDWTELRVE